MPRIQIHFKNHQREALTLHKADIIEAHDVYAKIRAGTCTLYIPWREIHILELIPTELIDNDPLTINPLAKRPALEETPNE